MNAYVRKILILLTIVLSWFGHGFSESIEVPVVPKPQIVEKMTGTFLLRPDEISIRIVPSDMKNLDIAIRQLQEALEMKIGGTVPLHEEKQRSFWLGLPKLDAEYDRMCQSAGIWPDDRLGTEGYVLLVGDTIILIAANENAGLFYGVQTLKQILRGSTDKDKIQNMKIIDWPDLRYRGMQDDISRGPVPTMDFMKQQVRRISEMKLNLLSYYTEHVVETEQHGDFAPAGGALSIVQWKELSVYAEQYHVKLMGNFQSLGHFEKIMAYPQYRVLGETDRMISPTDPEAMNFLRNIYAEMVPVFSSEFFNVNCDETWDIGRGGSRQAVDSLGVGRVYAEHIIRLNEEVKRHGKRMMIWGDIVLEHPEILEILPDDIIMGAWHYSAFDSFDEYMLPYKNAGFEFMFSCGVLNSGRMMPDYNMTFTNIRNFVRDGASHGALGMLNTVWDDGGKALFSLDWYGVAYGADHSWNVNVDSIEEFSDRFDLGIYGDHSNTFSRSIRELTKLTSLAPTQEMNESIFWKALVPDRGKKLELDLQDWDTVLKITKTAQALLKESEPTFYSDDTTCIAFTADQYAFLANSRTSLVETAQSYERACWIQRDDPSDARRSLVHSLVELGSVREMLEGLRTDYRTLWLRENRTYWLDHILTQYDEKILNIKETEHFLVQAIDDFDKGHSLPPPSEVSLAIRETSGQYFQYWLLCGSFPNVGWSGRSIDYLKPMGGELKARPRPGSAFTTAEDKTYSWMKYDSPHFSEIDLFSIYEENTEVLAYAYCQIESQRDQKVRATFGSNDGIKVICNGKEVYVNYQKRGLIVDEDECYLPLKKGQNHIMLKIDQNKGGWGFSFRLPDNIVRNHKYKYRIIL